MEKKNTKKLIIGAVILVVLIAVFALAYNRFSAKATAGSKNIVLEVTNGEGETTSYELATDAEYLRDAMDEIVASDDFSYEGTESDYGIMIETINGETADYTTDGAYWALYVNGEYGMYGADQQPVADGDTYTWVYESLN